MPVSRSQRRALIISELVTHGRQKYKWLYQFLDANAAILGKTILAPQYAEVAVLKGSNATKQKFLNTLRNISRKPQTKAVDVVLSLHGADGRLWFSDGPIDTEDLSSQIADLNLDHKLRLIYSVACYGRSHRRDFINAGFRTASGANQTNCNAASDYPAQLMNWVLGQKYRQCVKIGNSQPARGVADSLATLMGFNDADSQKWVLGYKDLRISSNAG